MSRSQDRKSSSPKTMKRYGNLYQKMLTMENLRLAYKKSRKGKTWQVVVKEFDKDIDGNLKSIQDLLINKTFRTAEYRTRMIFEPKKREIFCLPLSPDRIVHHAIMNVLIDQIKRYEGELPFYTTMKKIDRYYTFT